MRIDEQIEKPKCNCTHHDCQDKAEYLSGGCCYWCKLFYTYEVGCWAKDDKKENNETIS